MAKVCMVYGSGGQGQSVQVILGFRCTGVHGFEGPRASFSHFEELLAGCKEEEGVADGMFKTTIIFCFFPFLLVGG